MTMLPASICFMLCHVGWLSEYSSLQVSGASLHYWSDHTLPAPIEPCSVTPWMVMIAHKYCLEASSLSVHLHFFFFLTWTIRTSDVLWHISYTKHTDTYNKNFRLLMNGKEKTFCLWCWNSGGTDQTVESLPDKSIVHDTHFKLIRPVSHLACHWYSSSNGGSGGSGIHGSGGGSNKVIIVVWW
jgi:hypothetical protein